MGQGESCALLTKRNSTNMLSQFWKTTFIYGLGFIGLRMVSFLLLPLYTHLLSPSDAGIIFIIYTVLAFFNTIYSRGMDAALFKFYDQENSSTVISTSIIYSTKYGGFLTLFLFTVIVACFNGGLIQHTAISYTVSAGLLFVLFGDMLASRGMGILRLEEKPLYYLFVSLINVCVNVLFNIYFIKTLGMGLVGAIWAIIIASLIQIIILSPVLVSNVRLSDNSADLLQKMKKFSLPFLPAAIFLILIELSDRWMIGLMSPNGTADVGIYTAGYKFGSLIMLCVRAFNLNWQPYYLKKDTSATFYKIGSLFLSLLIILTTLLSILWPILFWFLIGEDFWSGGAIIPIIAISYIFYGLFVLQMPSLYLKNKEQWAPRLWGIGFLINVCCNCVLIPLYGYYGAAFATLFAYAGMAFFIVYKNYNWMPMKYSLPYLGCILVISVLVLCYGYYTDNWFWMIRLGWVGQQSFWILHVFVASVYLLITLPIIWLMYKKI